MLTFYVQAALMLAPIAIWLVIPVNEDPVNEDPAHEQIIFPDVFGMEN